MRAPQFHTVTEELSATSSRFVLEPLLPSFGQSFGNALRRTLLSSLPGAAVGYLKISGVSHMFSTMKGVKESVLELALHLKQLRFETTGEGEYTIHLTTKGMGVVTGKDVEGEVSVVNPDVYLAEITDDKTKLDIEAVVQTGYGYIPSEEKEKRTDFITLDTSFSPVRRVNFKVEAARVGRVSNFERLIMEIETDGSITPQAALKDAAQMVSAHFGHIFATDGKEQAAGALGSGTEQQTIDPKLKDIIIDELNLPSRVINALLRENIETVADLVAKGQSQLVGLKGVGKKSIDLIQDELRKMGVELK